MCVILKVLIHQEQGNVTKQHKYDNNNYGSELYSAFRGTQSSLN